MVLRPLGVWATGNPALIHLGSSQFLIASRTILETYFLLVNKIWGCVALLLQWGSSLQIRGFSFSAHPLPAPQLALYRGSPPTLDTLASRTYRPRQKRKPSATVLLCSDHRISPVKQLLFSRQMQPCSITDLSLKYCLFLKLLFQSKSPISSAAEIDSSIPIRQRYLICTESN